MKRPTGVTILAVLAIIVGVGYLLMSLPFFGLSAFAASIVGSDVLAVMIPVSLGAIAGVVSLVMGALYLTFGIGALGLKSWAWTLGFVATGASVVFGLMSLLGGVTVGGAIGLVVAVGIMLYLFTTTVREAFGHGTHHAPSGSTPTMSH